MNTVSHERMRTNAVHQPLNNRVMDQQRTANLANYPFNCVSIISIFPSKSSINYQIRLDCLRFETQQNALRPFMV